MYSNNFTKKVKVKYKFVEILLYFKLYIYICNVKTKQTNNN